MTRTPNNNKPTCGQWQSVNPSDSIYTYNISSISLPPLSLTVFSTNIDRLLTCDRYNCRGPINVLYSKTKPIKIKKKKDLIKNQKVIGYSRVKLDSLSLFFFYNYATYPGKIKFVLFFLFLFYFFGFYSFLFCISLYFFVDFYPN